MRLDRKGGRPMKKGCILLLLMSVISLPLIAQNIIYSNLKELLAQDGDTVAVLRVERRSKNQIVLTGGADYRITAGNDESMCRRLKKRCFAVRDEKGDLYLNCRKLRYKKLRFGAWYAPAVQLGKKIYFCAMPLGSVVGGNFVEEDDVKLGGNIGDALAASSLVTKRVCYELNAETGKIEFLDKNKMVELLKKSPELKKAYLKEDSQEAKHTFKYLLELKAVSYTHLAQDCAKIAFDLGLRKVKAYVKGPGNGRESAIRTIHGAGIEVTEIIDVTPLPHNGCRPPKRRRV